MNRAPRPRKMPTRQPASVPETAAVPVSATGSVPLLSDASAWFAARGWKPFDFQREVWTAMASGDSGLLHATTGAGKTYAVWLGALQALANAE